MVENEYCSVENLGAIEHAVRINREMPSRWIPEEVRNVGKGKRLGHSSCLGTCKNNKVPWHPKALPGFSDKLLLCRDKTIAAVVCVTAGRSLSDAVRVRPCCQPIHQRKISNISSVATGHTLTLLSLTILQQFATWAIAHPSPTERTFYRPTGSPFFHSP